MADFILEPGQLGPELDGYPVRQLLGFLGNPSGDAQAGHCLVDQCLSSWITALESALDAMPSELDDSLTRLAHRQRGA